MSQYSELRKEIFQDGKITEEDIVKLKAFLHDEEGMTKAKGDFLFELKHAISPEHQIREFRSLFVNAITELLLEDEESPGEIDESEAKWLRAKMQSNGVRDDLDDLLLDNLKEKSINFPDILNYKGKYARMFENCLYFSRYLTIFAVIGSILSAIALFVRGSISVVQGLTMFFQSFTLTGEGDYEILLATFVSSVDIYLFAMVLIIFGVGIYELFINKIDPVERKAEARPSWLQVSSIDDLKSSLGKVILMVLIVSFFKNSLDVEVNSTKDLLLLALGVVLIAASLYIANSHHHPKSK